MSEQSDNQDVGASFPVLAVIATGAALAMLVLGIYLYRADPLQTAYGPLVIGTGTAGGTYHALGRSLQAVLQETGAFETVSARATEGSEENAQLMNAERDGVHLAFVQADASGGAEARLVGTLYDEVLHVLVRAPAPDEPPMESISDLEGRRVALGPANSGTRDLSSRILDHFGVAVAEDVIAPPAEALAGLLSGRVDALFLLSAIPAPMLAELPGRANLRLLSFGDVGIRGGPAHALELVIPGLRSALIPRSTYGRIPRRVVRTVSVAATLQARADLDEELVRMVTAAVFERLPAVAGSGGAGLAVAQKIREDYDPATAALPYHPGATAYYLREEPPFFVAYAEALSLGLTALLAAYSLFIALREWLRRRMKNRVDSYLVRVESLVADSAVQDIGILRQRQQELEKLRREAFADLVAERLVADASFTILQDHLRDEQAHLAGLIARAEEVTPP